MMSARVDDCSSDPQQSLIKRNLRLDNSLKDKSKTSLNPTDINTILMNLINRKRFNYMLRDILEYLIRCMCLRKLKFKKHSGSRKDWDQKIKKHYQFNEGEDKLFDELDVITMLKSMRRIKLLTQTLLTQS